MADETTSKENPNEGSSESVKEPSSQGNLSNKTEEPAEELGAEETGAEEHEEHEEVPRKSSSATKVVAAAEKTHAYEGEEEEEEMYEDEMVEETVERLDTIAGDDGLVQPQISMFNLPNEEGEEEEEYVESETEKSSESAGNFSVNLDKTRLQTVFEEVYRYKRHAERRRILLNRKVSEYYRRQQNYGVFNQESASVHREYIQRYRMLLLEMDGRMAAKKQFQIDAHNHIGPLKKAIEETKQEYINNCDTFEKLFYDTAITLQGAASGKELKETTVLNIIKRMQNVRNIINVERLEFIKTQNLVAEIEVKAKSLEDLGNGLRMVDFEQLRSETQSLSDKIEERNNELEKLRLRCNADTQILAHVREKDFMLHKLILNQREILKGTNADVDAAREKCNHLKIERDTYRKKHNELSVDCGLLDKPLLLRDYDITIDAIETKQKEIAQLQKENEIIEKAVHNIAIILSEGELIKTDSQKFEEKLLNEISYMDAPIFPRIKKN